MKAIFIIFIVLAFTMLFFATYVRLAPSDPDVWHMSPKTSVRPSEIQTQTNGATLLLPTATLDRFDAVAMASPRTKRLAGSITEGRITWITRSKLWGFPDYTTAETTAEGLKIYARLRFGISDLGTNAARLRDWQSKL